MLVQAGLLFHLMLNSTVLPLRVLPDGDQVHILIASVNAGNTPARTDVGIQVEHSEKKRGIYSQLIMMVQYYHGNTVYPGARYTLDKWCMLKLKLLTFLVSDSVIQLLFQSEFQAALHVYSQDTYMYTYMYMCIINHT